MVAARPFIEKNIHPTEIVNGYFRALEDAIHILDDIAQDIDVDQKDQVMRALQSCIGTKFAFRWGTLISDLSLAATKIIMKGGNLNKLNLEIKRYAKVEKIPGGNLEDSEVLNGVMVNKVSYFSNILGCNSSQNEKRNQKSKNFALRLYS